METDMIVTHKDNEYRFTTPYGDIWFSKGINHIYKLGTNLSKKEGAKGSELLRCYREAVKYMFEQTDCLILQAIISPKHMTARMTIQYIKGLSTDKKENNFVEYELTLGAWARAQGIDPMSVIENKPK